MDKSVVLGFSGGIDSCTAAQHLRNEGYRVVALTINTTNDHKLIETAKLKAQEIGIEWLEYDATEQFKQDIVDYFTSSYANGCTPAPCTLCNTRIKWPILCKVADSLGIYHIATGHYLDIVERDGHLYIARALDSNKDQSYYLWGVYEETLRRMLTPMRQVLKSDIRENFTNKKESMGICFLNGSHYTDFLKSQGVDFSSGDIVNNRYQIIGQHNGIARYTIGQRRGVGIPEGMRVTGLDATNNRLIVGDNNELYKQKLYINECRITNPEELLSADDITIMIRGIGRNPEHPVKVKQHANGYCVICDDPAWAPAVGQPLVFYRKNLVIGGGIICSFE